MRINGCKISEFYSMEHMAGKFRTPLDLTYSSYYDGFGYNSFPTRFVEGNIVDNNPYYASFPIIPARGINKQNGLININSQCECCSLPDCSQEPDEDTTDYICDSEYDLPSNNAVYTVGGSLGFNTVQEAIDKAASDGKQYPLIYCRKDITESEIHRSGYVYHVRLLGIATAMEDPNKPEDGYEFRMPRIYTKTFNNFIDFYIKDFDVKEVNPTINSQYDDRAQYYLNCKFENITLPKGDPSSASGNSTAGTGTGVYLPHCYACVFNNIKTGDGGDGDTCDNFDSSDGLYYFCDNGGKGGTFNISDAKCCSFEKIVTGDGGKGAHYESASHYGGGHGGSSGGIAGTYERCQFRKITLGTVGEGGESQFWIYSNANSEWETTTEYRNSYGGHVGITATTNNCLIDGLIVKSTVAGSYAFYRDSNLGHLSFNDNNTIKNVTIEKPPDLHWVSNYHNGGIPSISPMTMSIGSGCVVNNIKFADGVSIAYMDYSFSAHGGYYSHPNNKGGASGGGGFASGGCSADGSAGRGGSGTYNNVRAKNITFGTGGISYRKSQYDEESDPYRLLHAGDGGWAGDGADWTALTDSPEDYDGGNLTVTGGSGLATSAGSAGVIQDQDDQPSDGTYTYTPVNEHVDPNDALVVDWFKGDGTDKVCNWLPINVKIKQKDDNGDVTGYKAVGNQNFLTVTISGSAGEVKRDCTNNCHSPYFIRSAQSTTTNTANQLNISYDDGQGNQYSIAFDVIFVGKKLEIRTHTNTDAFKQLTEASIPTVSPYYTGFYCVVKCYDTTDEVSGNEYGYDGEPTKDATWSVSNGKSVLMPEDYYIYIREGKYFVVPYDSSLGTLSISASLIGLSDSKDVTVIA